MVSESTVSNTQLSEFFNPDSVLGRELSEFLSAHNLCAKVNLPRSSQNSASLAFRSVSLSFETVLNDTEKIRHGLCVSMTCTKCSPSCVFSSAPLVSYFFRQKCAPRETTGRNEAPDANNIPFETTLGSAHARSVVRMTLWGNIWPVHDHLGCVHSYHMHVKVFWEFVCWLAGQHKWNYFDVVTLNYNSMWSGTTVELGHPIQIPHNPDTTTRVMMNIASASNHGCSDVQFADYSYTTPEYEYRSEREAMVPLRAKMLCMHWI